MLKKCENCGNEFDDITLNHNKRFCSDKCCNYSWYIKNKQHKDSYSNEYYKKNILREYQYQKQNYIDNKEQIQKRHKQYYKDNIKQIKEKRSIYIKNNIEKIRQKDYKYEKRRLKSDILFKLKKSLRSRLHCAINNNQKSGSTIKDLGCTIEEFKIYLESKFLPGMSWENHGLYGWHIDHIVPLSSFNLENREELLKACHYTNLQPLWAIDNLKKGNKNV